MTHTGIARPWKPVVNVTDLDEGERFWSAVSGLSPRSRHGQFSVLDAENPADGELWILLQLVPDGEDCAHGGTHLDFRVDDVEGAARQIEAIGGTVVKPADFYAPDGESMLEWAVMKDPIGNEFCIIRYP